MLAGKTSFSMFLINVDRIHLTLEFFLFILCLFVLHLCRRVFMSQLHMPIAIVQISMSAFIAQN